MSFLEVAHFQVVLFLLYKPLVVLVGTGLHEDPAGLGAIIDRDIEVAIQR